MYCTKCGNQAPDGVNFCPVCGQPVGAAAPQDLAAATFSPLALVFGLGSVALAAVLIFSGGGSSYHPFFWGSGGIWTLLVIVALGLGVAAIVLGALAKKRLPKTNQGMASAGFTLGIVGVVIWPVLILLVWMALMGLAAAACHSCAGMG